MQSFEYVTPSQPHTGRYSRVHATGSSLACPDWPLCYGSLLPEMKGGVAVEHSHRLAAGVVSLGTVFLAVLLTRRRKQQPVLWKVGWAAVVVEAAGPSDGPRRVKTTAITAAAASAPTTPTTFTDMGTIVSPRTSINTRSQFPRGSAGGKSLDEHQVLCRISAADSTYCGNAEVHP